MRVWRALKECGAAVLRDGVYLLPTRRDAAALGKLEKEIRSHGGFAMTFDATPQASDDQAALRARFDRTAEYARAGRANFGREEPRCRRSGRGAA